MLPRNLLSFRGVDGGDSVTEDSLRKAFSYGAKIFLADGVDRTSEDTNCRPAKALGALLYQ